jgi:poly(A) polymerase
MNTDRSNTTEPIHSLAGAAWLKAPALSKIFAAFAKSSIEIRVVGGATRNALLQKPISDIDLATPARPERVTEIATKAGLAVYPTGIEHGTVTVVADGTAFEVTTLRRDVETDGRRAVVAFTDDWLEDAMRRDFTINAIYAAPDGTISDPVGGLDDLKAARVRFIGEASDRIREDYLRILRFFRFTAQYGRGAPDSVGLAACTSLKAGLTKLSSERVGAEIMKLLDAPRAAEIAAVMAGSSVLDIVFGASSYPDRLSRLSRIEMVNGIIAGRCTRLAALALDGPSGARSLATRLRLANADADALTGAATPSAAYDPETPEKAARAWLYACGKDAFQHGSLVAWAASSAAPDDALRKARTALPERWTAPVIPVRGADVIGLGVPPGARVGEILRAFEDWWIGQDFPDNPALHMEILNRLVNRG